MGWSHASRISMISIARRMAGASDSILCPSHDTRTPRSIAGRRKSWLPCPRILPGNASPPKSAKSRWDGYVSDDGVLYGLPGTLQLAGKQVQVRERKAMVSVWSAGKEVFAIEKRPRSQESVPHEDQWKTVASASASSPCPHDL